MTLAATREGGRVRRSGRGLRASTAACQPSRRRQGQRNCLLHLCALPVLRVLAPRLAVRLQPPTSNLVRSHDGWWCWPAWSGTHHHLFTFYHKGWWM